MRRTRASTTARWRRLRCQLDQGVRFPAADCRGQGFRRGCRPHPPESGGTARSHGSSGGDRGKTTLLSLNGVLWKNLLGIF